MNDLLNHYPADVTVADQRHGKCTFELRGVIAEVDKAVLLSPYKVVFRLPGQSLKVVCEVRPPEEFTKVYVTTDREKVIGETERRGVTFAIVGTEVTYRGQCPGLRDNSINLVGGVRLDSP